MTIKPRLESSFILNLIFLLIWGGWGCCIMLLVIYDFWLIHNKLYETYTDVGFKKKKHLSDQMKLVLAVYIQILINSVPNFLSKIILK